MGPETAPRAGLFNLAERKRMVSLSVLFVVVSAMVVYGWYDHAAKLELAAAEERVIDEPPAEVVVITPEVDVAALARLVADASPEDRLVIEGPALEALFEPARLLNDAHFAPMGGALLDAAVVDELLANPDESRGNLFRARGFVDLVDTFDAGSGSTAHYRGRLRLEGGGHAWFTVAALPEAYGSVGDFVRIDGLFLKAYRGTGPGGEAGGEWIEAPLLVGPRAVQSFPALEPVTELDVDSLRFVEDDGLSGIRGQPFFEYWRLLSYAQNVAPGTVDWSEAPALDENVLLDITKNGGAWRGKPIRIPPSQLMDIWDQAQGENPARIEKLAEGWAGNEYWSRTTSGVIRIVAPFERGELRRRDLFTGRGFFLRNFAYERADGNLAIAAFFVMHSLEPYELVQDGTWTMIFSSIAMALVVILLLMFVGVMRDRKKTRQLQTELRRRRQARRAAAPTQDLAGPQPSS